MAGYERGLNERQLDFCVEMCKGLPAKQAAKNAGYAPTAASALMRNPKVLKRIKDLKEQRIDRMGISIDYVLEKSVKIFEECEKNMMYENQRGEKKLDTKVVHQALAALKLIGEHVNINAFKTKSVLEVHNAENLTVQQMNNYSTLTLSDAATQYKKLMG